MFDKIGDLPLHPLVVHAAVIGIPLAALLALLFAFPKTREWARWPLAITVVGATAVTFVARESGLALEAAMGIKPGNPVGDLILQHSLLANQAVLHHDRVYCHRPAQCVPRFEAHLRWRRTAQQSSPPSCVSDCRFSW